MEFAFVAIDRIKHTIEMESFSPPSLDMLLSAKV